MKALLLAGGRAQKLKPFTSTRSKPLIPIANESIVMRNVRLLRDAGITDLVIVTLPGDTAISDVIGNGSNLGIHIDYMEQEGEGIGKAVLTAKDRFFKGQYFLLGYADILATQNIYTHILSIFNRVRRPIATVCLTSSSPRHYGNVYLDEQMRITRIIEKPESADMGNYILGGVFMLPYDFFEDLEANGGDISHAYENLASAGTFYAAIWENDWLDINHPWSILQANCKILGDMKESRIASDVEIPMGVTISGPVVIESGVTICEGVVIRGPAIIGKNCFIGNNVLIRDCCSIGANSEIGYGTELKNTVIFGKAIIGRISYLGDSVVGEGAHIGSCTMTINYPIDSETVSVDVLGNMVDSQLRKLGAFIGDKVVIGASNTIKAGAIVDAGSVVKDHFTVPRGEE